jgi:two-component system sensor histidine kinase CiaH
MTAQTIADRFVRSKTTRLALSYLGIIMLLCIGFSLASYVVASGVVSPKIVESQSLKQDARKLQADRNATINSSGVAVGSGDTRRIATQLSANPKLVILRKTLIALNVVALLLGGIVSYCLARWTLRPIEAAMEAQSRFASDASHELRTPLTVMQLEIENALQKSNFPEVARKLLESNLEEIRHLQKLSDGLLRLARQPQALEASPLWADEIVSLAINRVAKQVQVKNIAVVDAVPHVQILAEEQSLIEVLVILLENAVKHSKKGTSIYMEGRTDKKYTCVTVRDEGPGIETVDLPHVFERFYRSETSRRQLSGHGLGLAIAQALMERQHGKITVGSTIGQGSIFTIKSLKYKAK